MTTHSTNPDLIAIIDALYRVEQPREKWLEGVLHASAAAFPSHVAFAGVFYEIADNDCVRSEVQVLGGRAELQDTLDELHRRESLRANIVAAYRSTLASTAAEFITDRRAFRPICERQFRAGLRDTLLINGSSPVGLGCALNIFAADAIQLSEAQRDILSKVAMHLAGAYRLQQRLAESERSAEVEAIFSAKGKLEHVDSPLEFQVVRSSLSKAIAQRAWARKQARYTPAEAVTAWTSLVHGRWTLVDEHESNGAHYIVARRNVVQSRAPRALSSRERDVVALASVGRSNKYIAYELGLAHSTVRVLLHRAMIKLGATSRSMLVERMRAAALDPDTCDKSAQPPSTE